MAGAGLRTRGYPGLYIGSISASPTTCPSRGYGRAGTQNDCVSGWPSSARGDRWRGRACELAAEALATDSRRHANRRVSLACEGVPFAAHSENTLYKSGFLLRDIFAWSPGPGLQSQTRCYC